MGGYLYTKRHKRVIEKYILWIYLVWVKFQISVKSYANIYYPQMIANKLNARKGLQCSVHFEDFLVLILVSYINAPLFCISLYNIYLVSFIILNNVSTLPLQYMYLICIHFINISGMCWFKRQSAQRSDFISI